MKSIGKVRELMEGAREREQAGHSDTAADLYQRIVDDDPANRDAVRRLLIVYRKLKEYRNELSVVDAALGVVAQRDKTAQTVWLAAHPEAAKLGKDMLKSLGGEQVTAYGTDPFVEQLLRRKELLERKLSGSKGKRARKTPSKTTANKQNERAADLKRRASERKKQEAGSGKAGKKAAAERRRAEAEVKKQQRQAAAEQKRQEAKEKNAARLAAARNNATASLFVIFLHYLAPLEEIDAAMKKHVAFLDKYFAKAVFLVAGRQVPRTGGVILAQVRDRKAAEQIIKQDPFVRGKLATVEIVEFKAIKMGKGLQRIVKGK
jgi:uncharacterized protein YciI